MAGSLVSGAHAVDLIGYVPYYRLSNQYVNNVLPGQLAMLDEVRYFGLTVDNGGQIVPTSGSLASHMANIATIKSLIEDLPEASRPRLDITLGGAGEDATFTTVAANSSLRDVLATEVDTLLNNTGATAVDIDWEHPDAGIQRTTHYPALLKRLKQEVGPDRRVYATVAPSVVISNSVFSGPDAIDGVSLMTYDLGWWGNDPSNSNSGEHSLQEYVEDTVAAWTDAPGSPNQRPYVFGSWGNGAPANKLGAAIPFYGRNITNGAAYTYEQLVSGGSSSDGNYYSFGGQTVWITGADLVEERVEFAIENELQSLIIWEMAQDLAPTSEGSLLRRAYETKQALTAIPGDYDGNGLVDPEDAALWRATYGSSTNLGADGNSDGVVDAIDYTIWRDAVNGTTSQLSLVVPEPGMMSIVAVQVVLMSITRRHR